MIMVQQCATNLCMALYRRETVLSQPHPGVTFPLPGYPAVPTGAHAVANVGQATGVRGGGRDSSVQCCV